MRDSGRIEGIGEEGKGQCRTKANEKENGIKYEKKTKRRRYMRKKS